MSLYIIGPSRESSVWSGHATPFDLVIDATQVLAATFG